MITETMTPEEISRNIVDDYNLIIPKYLYRYSDKYDKLRRKHKVDKESIYPRIFEFRTPQKNKWIMILNKEYAMEKYKNTDDIGYTCFCYYFNDIGIRVFTAIQSPETGAALEGLIVFNSHFFTRYNERLNLGLAEPLDKVKHYFKNNPSSVGQGIETNGRTFVTGTVKTGYTLGEVQIYDGIMWWVNKTFISNETANNKDNELAKGLKVHLEQQIKDALDEDNFDEGKYYYLADILKGIQ